MQRLARGGVVDTRRGSGGGAVLAVEASTLRLGTLVRLLEEDQPLVECFAATGGNCPIEGRCRLKSRLRRAEAAFIDDLDRSTLADITLEPLFPSGANTPTGGEPQ